MVWTSSAGGIHPSKSQVAVAVLVVTGARKRRVATSCFSSSPVKRAHSEPGSLDAAGAGGASSPRAAFQNRLPSTTDSKTELSVGAHGHVHQAVPLLVACDTGGIGVAI